MQTKMKDKSTNSGPFIVLGHKNRGQLANVHAKHVFDFLFSDSEQRSHVKTIWEKLKYVNRNDQDDAFLGKPPVLIGYPNF